MASKDLSQFQITWVSQILTDMLASFDPVKLSEDGESGGGGIVVVDVSGWGCRSLLAAA